jgi:hypothetical protein
MRCSGQLVRPVGRVNAARTRRAQPACAFNMATVSSEAPGGLKTGSAGFDCAVATALWVGRRRRR